MCNEAEESPTTGVCRKKATTWKSDCAFILHKTSSTCAQWLRRHPKYIIFFLGLGSAMPRGARIQPLPWPEVLFYRTVHISAVVYITWLVYSASRGNKTSPQKHKPLKSAIWGLVNVLVQGRFVDTEKFWRKCLLEETIHQNFSVSMNLAEIRLTL